MATFDRTCRGCGESFESKSGRAVWCSARCRKRAQRNPVVVDPSADVLEPADQPDDDADSPTGGLVASVLRDLVAAGREDTFDGQLALQLARKMTDREATGVASLSKELRVVLASALAAGDEPAEGADPAPAGDPVDEVAKKRDHKRTAAGETSA